MFLSLLEPNKPVSLQTISKWSVQTIQIVYENKKVKLKGNSKRAVGPSLMVLQWNQSWIQQIETENPLSVTFIWEIWMPELLKRCKFFLFNPDKRFFSLMLIVYWDETPVSCHEETFTYICVYNVQNWGMIMHLKWWYFTFLR